MGEDPVRESELVWSINSLVLGDRVLGHCVELPVQ